MATSSGAESGELSASEVLQVSSNIGATKIAFALGPRLHSEMLERFGFGSATGLGFPGESAGLLRPWQRWRPGNAKSSS